VALTSVASKMLNKLGIKNTEVFKAVEHFLPTVFLSVDKMAMKFYVNENRHIYITPKNYLDMLELFKIMLNKKRDNNSKNIYKLENGVKKITKALADVVYLESNLKTIISVYDEKRLVAEGKAICLGSLLLNVVLNV
jgi:dynein heavy chain